MPATWRRVVMARNARLSPPTSSSPQTAENGLSRPTCYRSHFICVSVGKADTFESEGGGEMWLRCENVLACHWANLELPRYGAAQQFSTGPAPDALRASLTSSDETGRSPAVARGGNPPIGRAASPGGRGKGDKWRHPVGIPYAWEDRWAKCLS
ncbi:hypothetical protein GY45DRAFT_636301 [Cubamyces sp. BRFM 1775]|nr:hypothetical protein GY45DRAFT_636301 [Cubamyces sp. BRFM 1775]